MMNKYTALVKKVDKDVEEEVTLSLCGFEVTCFAGVCPYQIQEGQKYLVSFELMIFDEYCVEESQDEVPSLERIDNGFSYWITGRLKDGVIDSLISFEDEILLSDYGYLNNKQIRVKTDRIDVDFLND
jgi:hypothetical protein